MRDKIARYARRLEGLSIAELSRGAQKFVSLERRHTAALIAHLAEISRARLQESLHLLRDRSSSG